VTVSVSMDAFEALVEEAIAALHPAVLPMLDNVAFFVEESSPQDPDLLGTYDGFDRTERGDWYSGALPDRITLYRLPHVDMAADEAELRAEISTTLKHEIAHHLGIDHARMHELGLD
jgi:predicted Zn-dependent protease with MMP-like domain